MIFVIMKELLRCFIVSSAHLHLQAPCFDVLALVNGLHCFELTETLLCWLGMSHELFKMGALC